jgi:hypothetical protein
MGPRVASVTGESMKKPAVGQRFPTILGRLCRGSNRTLFTPTKSHMGRLVEEEYVGVRVPRVLVISQVRPSIGDTAGAKLKEKASARAAPRSAILYWSQDERAGQQRQKSMRYRTSHRTSGSFLGSERDSKNQKKRWRVSLMSR